MSDATKEMPLPWVNALCIFIFYTVSKSAHMSGEDVNA